VAVANAVARIARPLTVIENNDAFPTQLASCIADNDAEVLVVGLPRGLNGQHTAQTEAVEQFIVSLKRHISLPMYWQDEAVTSQKAEAELNQRTKRGQTYQKGDIDALAATYILEDFLTDHPEMKA